MERETQFFIIFLATILITRLFLFVKPIASPTIKGFRFHHYMYGILLDVIAVFLKNLTAYAIGLGLLVDQLPYLVRKRETHGARGFDKSIYWLKKHVIVLMVFIVLVFLFKKYFLFF